MQPLPMDTWIKHRMQTKLKNIKGKKATCTNLFDILFHEEIEKGAYYDKAEYSSNWLKTYANEIRADKYNISKFIQINAPALANWFAQSPNSAVLSIMRYRSTIILSDFADSIETNPQNIITWDAKHTRTFKHYLDGSLDQCKKPRKEAPKTCS